MTSFASRGRPVQVARTRRAGFDAPTVAVYDQHTDDIVYSDNSKLRIVQPIAEMGEEPPSGAVALQTRIVDVNGVVIDDAFYEFGEDRVFPLGLLRLTTTNTRRFAQWAWRDADGNVGVFSMLRQVEPVLPRPSTAVLEFITLPTLIVDPVDGLRVGASVDATSGTFTGDSDDAAVLTLWRTDALTDVPTGDGSNVSATEIGSYTFGVTALPAGALNKAVWVRSAITDGTSTVYAWSVAAPSLVADVPDPVVELEEGDVELIDVVEIEDGVFQTVLWIDPAKVDAADYDGYDAATGVKVRATFTATTVALDLALANWHPVIPGDYNELNAPMLTAIDDTYTGANGYWRITERPDQTTANAGTTWEKSWALKESRSWDTVAPRRVLRLFHVSTDGGASFGPLSSWTIQPDIPADPPASTSGEYWKPLERSPGQTTWTGFGVQFVRCLAFCEDEPQYGIVGGDMNGVRVTETMGASWYHPDNLGLRTPGLNSMFIDPRDHNYCLALGNMVWWAPVLPYSTTISGLYRTTDFGKNWSRVAAIYTSGNDGWNQSLFCYTPSTRSGAVSQRQIWLFNRHIENFSQTPTAVELWRSDNGGASWTLHFSTTSVGTYGRLYKAIAHPSDGTLYLACETGLYKSNSAKSTFTRVAGGLPANRIQSVEISPDGTKMYATCRPMFFTSDPTQNGLWYTSNSGASWSRIYYTGNFFSYNAADLTQAIGVRRVCVNWQTTPEIVALQLDRSAAPQAVMSFNGPNGPWQHATSTGAPGWPAEDTYHRNLCTRTGIRSNGYRDDDASGMIAIKSPGVFLINSVGRMFQRTATDGLNWDDTSLGFTGVNVQAASGGVPMIAQSGTKILIPSQDINAFLSTDGGQHFTTMQAVWDGPDADGVPEKADLAEALGVSAIGSSYYAAITGTGRLVLGYGDIFSQGVTTSDDNGATWVPRTGFGSGAHGFFKHPTASPETWACGFAVTKNNFASVAVEFNGRAVGVDANGALYVMRGYTEIHKSVDWHTSSAPTFTPFYSGPSFSKSEALAPKVHVAKSESNVIYVTGSGGDLRRVTNTGTTFASASIVEVPLSGQTGVPQGNQFGISFVTSDPNVAGRFYVTIFGSGYAGQIWRCEMNAAKTAVATRENITSNAPKWQDQSIHVLNSGDVVVGGAQGPWCYPRPSGYPTGTSIWPGLATPIKAPLNTADVTNTTELLAAIASAVNGEVIYLAGGNYTTATISSRSFSAASPVVLRAFDRNNPPIFTGSVGISLADCVGLTLDGLHFRYNTNAGNTLGINMTRCTDVIVKNCNFEGYHQQFGLSNRNTRVQFLYSTMRGSMRDFIVVGGRNQNITLRGLDVRNHNFVDIGAEHRDFIQFFTNPGASWTGTDGRYGSSDVLIEKCNFINGTITDNSFAPQGIFIYNDMLRVIGSFATYPTYGSHTFTAARHTNITVRDCYVDTNHPNAVAMGGVDGGTIDSVKIVGANSARVNLYRFNNAGGVARNNNLTITDTVAPNGPDGAAYGHTDEFGTIAAPIVSGTFTATGNTTSSSAWPSGWLWEDGEFATAGQYAGPAGT